MAPCEMKALGSPIIPRWELSIYMIVWVITLGYSCYSVYLTSQEYREELNPHLFVEGWSYLQTDKDVGDYEWVFFYGWFWKVLPWYFFYSVLSQLTHWLFKQYHTMFSLVFSAVSLVYIMSLGPVVLIAAHCFIGHLATISGSIYVVWFTCLVLLSTLNFEPFLSLMKKIVTDDPEENQFYLLLFSLALCNLRIISFCVEKVWYKHKLTQKLSANPDSTTMHAHEMVQPYAGFRLVDLLFYVSYLPLFYTGPLLTYDVFKEQIKHCGPKWNSEKLFQILKQFARIIGWACFNEFLLHYFYFHSLQHNHQVMLKMSLWSLAGVGYLHGQFFMVKYVVMFGFPSCLAQLDGIITPAGPKCISRISNYSDMWKYFDRGLYSFIKRYIYVPLGGSRHGVIRQLAGSAVTFLFVFYWHGAEYYLFLWAVFNYIGITIEVLAHRFSKLQSVKDFEERWLGAGVRCRFKALMTVPLFAMSSLSIFVFFGGTETGMVFFDRLLFEGWPLSAVLIVSVFYCGVHVCTTIEHWENNKMKIS